MRFTSTCELAAHKSNQEMPEIPAYRDLYNLGCTFKQGDVIMIVGRPGTQKSGFTLHTVLSWDLPTLYLSADSADTTLDRVERFAGNNEIALEGGETEQGASIYFYSSVLFYHGDGFTPELINDLTAKYKEHFHTLPKVLVIDNLMDAKGATTDQVTQQEFMRTIRTFSQNYAWTSIVCHHCTDKGTTADGFPSPLYEIKNDVIHNTDIVLSLGVENTHDQNNTSDVRIAIIRQRTGQCDPTAKTFINLKCDHSRGRFLSSNILD